MTAAAPGMDALDRAIVVATQAGLPLVARPFDVVARQVGADAETVMARLRAMQARGALRRIAAVPNHYTTGLTANAMTVWDVDDAEVDRLGRAVGALPFVSHCYRRPRIEAVWPYNLFAMVHGRNRQETGVKASRIAAILGDGCRAHDLLYSNRILKKTGLRLRRQKGDP